MTAVGKEINVTFAKHVPSRPRLLERKAPVKGGKPTFFSSQSEEASGKDLTTLRIGTSSRR